MGGAASLLAWFAQSGIHHECLTTLERPVNQRAIRILVFSSPLISFHVCSLAEACVLRVARACSINLLSLEWVPTIR
jgi:hypothetical protein